METKKRNNVKLGLLVLAGMGLLMTAMYFIGKHENSWSSGMRIRVCFREIEDLKEGSIVLYAGMPAGSVQKIHLVNDSTIEVILQIDNKTSPFIHLNARATISSDGLMGNKIVDITPVPGNVRPIAEGDLLAGDEQMAISRMLVKIPKINDNVAAITAVVKKTVIELDSSELLRMLKSPQTGIILLKNLKNIEQMTSNAAAATSDVRQVTADLNNNNGSIKKLLRDTVIYSNIRASSIMLQATADSINRISGKLSYQLTNGRGLLSILLTDSTAGNALRATTLNAQNGTYNFNEDMKALQHNFLLRGYFKRKEKAHQDSVNKHLP